MKCRDCKHAEWTRTPNGRIKKNVPGRCNAEVKMPAMLCLFEPLRVNKIAIWPSYEGQCDLHESAGDGK